ncbi:phosphorylase [groundwater metagenome]
MRDPIGLEKAVGNLQEVLSDICEKLPEDKRGSACKLLKKASNEQYIDDKINLINLVVERISSEVGKVRASARKHGTIEKDNGEEIPYSAELESEICDIFKSIYQKERKIGASEVNSKTLEFLKFKLHDLVANGKEILWLDVGCGDGRCLEVLDEIHSRENLKYHGIDFSYKYLDNAEKLAQKYKLDAKVEKMDAAAMKFDSLYDLSSAILLLHEIDPLCLPYVLKNILSTLKDYGTLVISDFEGPYEQEENVVAWSAEEIKQILTKIVGANMSVNFVSSGEYPTELGFYRCYVKKPEFNHETFENFMQRYSDFLKAKKEDSKKKRNELRNLINKRVYDILNRPNIDTKNLSEEDMKNISSTIENEYGIKAHKIRLLTNQIIFLDDKIEEQVSIHMMNLSPLKLL